MQVDTGDERALVLRQLMPEIHEILVRFYRFIDEEAEAFESILAVWSERAARRMGSSRVASQDLQSQILYVACKYARAFQLARFRGSVNDSPLAENLAQPPDEVAFRALTLINRKANQV